jgi:DNA primase small subunit
MKQVSLSKKKNEGLPHPLHPMLKRAYEVLEPLFVESVLPESGHGLLASQESWEALLDTLPDAAKDSVGEKLRDEWQTSISSPQEKWAELKRHLRIKFGKKDDKSKRSKTFESKESIAIEHWPVETVFKYTYPRLDINVSKMQNHLLKSPFCVHPKTGRVCVPINVETVEQFDPFDVPTLPQLMKELDDYSGEDTRREWQKTSLKGYFEPFQKNFLEPMLSEKRKAQMKKVEETAAMTGDF